MPIKKSEDSSNHLDKVLLATYFKHRLDLPESEIKSIVDLFRFKTFKHQMPVVQSASLWREVLFIKKGILRLYYTTEDGKEFNKGFFAEGQLIWPMAPTARVEPSLFSIEAIEGAELYVANFQILHERLNSIGKWQEFSLPFVESFADQKFLREYQFLVFSAEQHYLQFLKELGSLALRLPDYHIASYLGITHVALSRIKSRLRATGIITDKNTLQS